MKLFKFIQKSSYEKSGYLTLNVVAENLESAKMATSHSGDNFVSLTELPTNSIMLDKGFHATSTEHVQYRDLIPGDLVFESGCLFKLNAVWSAIWDCGREVVRCDDIYIPEYPGNSNMPYWAKSGVVGAVGKEKATIVKRCINPFIEN